VLLNLYSNAVKFTENGGKIHILIELVTIKRAKFIRIAVKDTGIGIKQES